jgi:adenylate cyclase
MKVHRLTSLALIVAASAAVALLAERYGRLTGVEGAEHALLGQRQNIAQRSRVAGESSEVMLVLFDSMSVDEWAYQSPFPRAFLAELVDAISAAGATAIGLDVFLDRTYGELNAIDSGDDLLHDAIERAGNVVLASRVVIGEDGPKLERPHPYFADVAAGVAAAELSTPFETVQDGTLAVRSEDRLEPSLALALWGMARGVDVRALLDEAQASGTLDVPGLPSPSARLDPDLLGPWENDGQFSAIFPLRFIGPPSVALVAEGRTNTFETHSGSVAAITASFLPEAFRDKVVLLGSGFHDSDKFRTPFYEEYDWMYGVEIHANALQNLLDGEFIRPMSSAAELALLLIVATLAGAVTFWRGATAGALVALATALGVYGLGVATFTGGVGAPYLAIPMTISFVAIALSYLGSVAYVSVIEGRDKRFIKSAFGKYVSPAVVEEIAENPEALKLGGAKRELTILFSDLAGFTDLSEKLDPQDLITMINGYLSEMTELVMDEQGTLDKYIGDAIMAFWNDPLPLPDHADRAIRCAIQMQRKMDELNARWRAADPTAAHLVVRIGINTGTVVVGNVGGMDHFSYSALGDAVNLAARLEPANKSYDTLIMASEYTLRAATPGAYRIRELDLITVKGKLRPVTVYEIIEMADVRLAEPREQALRHYDSGLVAYKRRDWELAATYFEAAVDSDPGDGPSAVYLERCRENIANPPPADWDFVVRRTAK